MIPPIDELSKDLDWRETELGLLKRFLQNADLSKKQHEVLSRAAWSLLYAHYEGFAKFCLTLFFDRAAKNLASCHELPQLTKEFALRGTLKKIRSLSNRELLEAIERFSESEIRSKPSFPEIDTKSNLWPNVLEDLLESADIQCPSIDTYRSRLRELVGRRNGIAHGDYVSADYSDYIASEQAVYAVMYDLALQVDARLQAHPFQINPSAAVG